MSLVLIKWRLIHDEGSCMVDLALLVLVVAWSTSVCFFSPLFEYFFALFLFFFLTKPLRPPPQLSFVFRFQMHRF